MQTSGTKTDMEVVKVSKEKLLGTLRANRAAHVAEYEEAVAGYFIKMKEKLQELLLEVEKNDINSSFYVDLPVPRNYDKSFAEAISILEWNLKDEIWLNLSDFRKYVLNEWRWHEEFKAVSTMYNSIKKF